MARVLVSPIGVGVHNNEKKIEDRKYREAVYKFTSGNEYKTCFVSAALVQELNIDRVFFIGTSHSMWEKVYEFFIEETNSDLDYKYWYELDEKVTGSRYDKKILSSKELQKVNQVVDKYLKLKIDNALGGSRCLVIDYGLNEEEMWKNFDLIMAIEKLIGEGDEIFLDITHSFRSISLFLYLLMDFLQTLKPKKVKLAGIFYGMLDVGNEMAGIAPVVDLKPFFEISRWARGVYDFVNYGNGYLISDLLDETVLSNEISNISDLININFLLDLKKGLDRLHYQLTNKDILEGKLFKYVYPHLIEFLERFRGINTYSMLQLELAGWYFENNRYASGFICLAESIVSKIVEEYNKAGAKLDIKKASDRIKINEKIKLKLLKFRLEYSSNPFYRKISKLYKEISKIRNHIAHAGLNEGEISYREVIEKASNYYNKVKNNIFKNSDFKNIPSDFPFFEL